MLRSRRYMIASYLHQWVHPFYGTIWFLLRRWLSGGGEYGASGTLERTPWACNFHSRRDGRRPDAAGAPPTDTSEVSKRPLFVGARQQRAASSACSQRSEQALSKSLSMPSKADVFCPRIAAARRCSARRRPTTSPPSALRYSWVRILPHGCTCARRSLLLLAAKEGRPTVQQDANAWGRA